MFKIFSNLAVFAVFLMFVSHLSNSQTSMIKVAVSDIPQQMTAGETYKVTCTITNSSGNIWSSEPLYAKAKGPFEISKEWTGEWKLNPGESTNVFYKVTAPTKPGTYKLRVTFYDGDKKIGYKSKKITVSGTSLK